MRNRAANDSRLTVGNSNLFTRQRLDCSAPDRPWLAIHPHPKILDQRTNTNEYGGNGHQHSNRSAPLALFRLLHGRVSGNPEFPHPAHGDF